jgi:RNA polymerase sigma-70 factor (ECF subfamily)
MKGYLFSCLRNFILNELRNFLIHERHHEKIALQESRFDTPQPAYDLKLMETRFYEALGRLSNRCRQVFLLSRAEQLPNKAIADRLNISVNAVEKHMNKALKVMRREFK